MKFSELLLQITFTLVLYIVINRNIFLCKIFKTFDSTDNKFYQTKWVVLVAAQRFTKYSCVSCNFLRPKFRLFVAGNYRHTYWPWSSLSQLFSQSKFVSHVWWDPLIFRSQKVKSNKKNFFNAIFIYWYLWYKSIIMALLLPNKSRFLFFFFFF